jgi:hypothetical protein
LQISKRPDFISAFEPRNFLDDGTQGTPTPQHLKPESALMIERCLKLNEGDHLLDQFAETPHRLKNILTVFYLQDGDDRAKDGLEDIIQNGFVGSSTVRYDLGAATTYNIATGIINRKGWNLLLDGLEQAHLPSMRRARCYANLISIMPLEFSRRTEVQVGLIPASADTVHDIAESYIGLAESLFRNHAPDYQRQLKFIQRAVSLSNREDFLRDGYDYPNLMSRIAGMYQYRGKYAEALRISQPAMDNYHIGCSVDCTLFIHAMICAEELGLHSDAMKYFQQLKTLISGCDRCFGVADLSLVVDEMNRRKKHESAQLIKEYLASMPPAVTKPPYRWIYFADSKKTKSTSKLPSK